MTYKALVVLLATMISCTAVLAQTQPAGGTTAATLAAAPTEPAQDKVICRSVVPTGSRLGTKKICMSKLDWEVRRRADAEWLKNAGRVAELSGQ
jgi:hypothetical protein